MDILNGAGVPMITTVVYVILQIYKNIVGENEKYVKIIPAIGGICGIVLGLICFFTMPNIIVADNILTAILIGASSGLASTGANQIVKQLSCEKSQSESPNINIQGSNANVAITTNTITGDHISTSDNLHNETN